MEGVPLHVLVERDGRGDEVWKDLCSVLDPFRLLSLKKAKKPPCPPAENAGQACQGKEQKILLFLIKYGIILEIIWNNGFLPLEGEGVPVHVLVEWDGRGE